MSTNTQPLAVVDGKPVFQLPNSLYVPPDALRVFLASFEGPLDFLHYLIKRNDMDIRDIRMAEITEQYLAYVNEIVDAQIELAADYLLMSATLIEIKSRMLLQIPASEEKEPEDPRAKLAERLLLYNRFCLAAENLLDRACLSRDIWSIHASMPNSPAGSPRISAGNLQLAMLGVMARKTQVPDLIVSGDSFSLREAMAHVFVRMRTVSSWLFSQLLGQEHATPVRVGVFFLAVLQMAKDQLIHVNQNGDEVQVSPRMGKVSRKP